jgi:hypothetical protein
MLLVLFCYLFHFEKTVLGKQQREIILRRNG